MPVIPKYKELSLENIWPLVQENEELLKYIPDVRENNFPEREFLWAILFTKMPQAVESLKKNARSQRSIQEEESVDNLVEFDPEIYAFIQSISSQKSKESLSFQ